MSKYLFIIIGCLLAFTATAQSYDHSKVSLLGNWHKPGNRYSSCWGYEQDNRRYAIVGRGDGTCFVDITDPQQMVLCDSVLSPITEAIWREYKSYGKYLYAISDDWGDNVMQIVDMSYLPDSVHVVYEGQDILVRGHTIFIDNDKMYIGIRRGLTKRNTMTVFDLKADPTHPVEIRSLDEDYPDVPDVHDMYVRNDTVYASAGNGGLHIFVLESGRFRKLGEYTGYPYTGYNHSSILSPDGKTLIFTDEVPGSLPGKVIDVSNIQNPLPLDTFYSQSGKATLHNPFIIDARFFVMSSYMDGIQIYDYADPANIRMTGYFDTYPQLDGPATTGGYDGSWSAYPWLSNGHLITVDMTNGLFVLDPSEALQTGSSMTKTTTERISLSASPNPAKGTVTITVPDEIRGEAEIAVYQTDGKLVSQKTVNITGTEIRIDLPEASGIFNILISHKNKTGYSAIINLD